MSTILSRRGFLVASGAAILAVSAPSIAKNIILTEALFIPNNTSKYNTALEMFDAMIEIDKSTAEIEWPDYTGVRKGASKEVHTRFNEMLLYVHTTFAAPDINAENMAQCAAFLETRYIGGARPLLEGTPPALADALWPIGLVKMVLAESRVKISAHEVPEFIVFHNRYSRMILS